MTPERKKFLTTAALRVREDEYAGLWQKNWAEIVLETLEELTAAEIERHSIFQELEERGDALTTAEARIAELEVLFREAIESAGHEAYLRIVKERDALQQYAEEAQHVIRALLAVYRAWYPAGSAALEVNTIWRSTQAFLARPVSDAEKKREMEE